MVNIEYNHETPLLLNV